jgi:hypothetical protein
VIIFQSVQVGRVTPCAPPVANQRVRRVGDCPPYQFCFSKIANRKACAEICRAKDAKKICGALSEWMQSNDKKSYKHQHTEKSKASPNDMNNWMLPHLF